MVEVENKIKRYEKYKDSRVEWLGEIPEHWELRRIKYLFNEINERSDNGDEDLLSVSQYTGVTNKSYKVEAGGMLTNAMTLEGYKKVKKGDLVSNIMLAWNGSLGFSPFDGITSPAYSIYRIYGENHNRYFHYLLRTELYKAEFKRNSSGVIESRLRLYTDDFFNILSILPPLPEQTKIAQFLDDKTTKIDDAIAIKQQQINLLKERKQILIHKAVTRGLDDSVTLKDSGVEWIGVIPAHWAVKRLKHCLTINNGSDYKHIQTDEGYPVIGSGGQFAYASDYMYDGEVVFLGRKGTIDKPLYFKGKFWAVDTMFYANAKNGNIVKFLYYVATTLPFSYYSTATALPSMTQSDLNNHPISLPSIEEQHKILDYIETASQKIETAISLKQQEIDKLKEYKRSLINSVVTGKLKVC
ncbi:restriction endonuclease subunit S [Olleya sp. R77988]|uniref:restriction endonuclease subunit S n=1 Tax=Olleya sp. R77988 TaxID=3093875 RepID=UPI0037C8D1DA